MQKNPIVTITMQDGGIMKAELYPEIAPITVENFLKLVCQGYYDGLTFHRIIPGFMVQGGCPDGTGTGGPGYQIKGEFSQNGVKNDLKHTLGVLSMARSGHPDSAGSQFFIMTAQAPHLDGGYAAFGKLIEGEDTLKNIEAAKTPRSEIAAGKTITQIVDCDGNPMHVHQGNADTPIFKVVIQSIVAEKPCDEEEASTEHEQGEEVNEQAQESASE